MTGFTPLNKLFMLINIILQLHNIHVVKSLKKRLNQKMIKPVLCIYC